MSISGLIFGLMIVVGSFVITWPLANLIIPQEEIDKIEAIGEWAKEELDKRKGEKDESVFSK